MKSAKEAGKVRVRGEDGGGRAREACRGQGSEEKRGEREKMKEIFSYTLFQFSYTLFLIFHIP